MESDEAGVLKTLDLLIRGQAVNSQLDEIISSALAKFAETPGVFFTWEVVPLSIFDKLPEGIRSSWIFMIRAGLPVEPHRHPNSHQRTMSLSGQGDLQIWKESGWHSHPITSDCDAAVEDRWVSIPENVWHRAIVTSDWVVLSFHTSAEDDLLEEAFADSRSKRKYSQR